MDTEIHYLAAGLFSPSKARQQQAFAKDWLFVDSWLSQRYAPERVPPFERNEETLQALLDLAAANERADEHQTLVHEVQQIVLNELTSATTEDENATVFDALEASLTDSGSLALDALVSTTILLNATTAQPETLAHLIIEATTTQSELAQQLRRTETLRQTLRAEHQRLEALMREVQGPAFATPLDLPQKTAEWNRGTKHLKAKLAEYNDRLDGSSVLAVPKPSLEDVAIVRGEGQGLREQVADLERQLAVYGDLPADAGGARERLEMAKSELRALIQRRDRHFEALVDNRPDR